MEVKENRPSVRKKPLSREEALQKTVFDLCTEGDLETVQTALKSFKSSKLPTDLVGSSPLHYAAKKNKLDIAKILIESNRCSLENKMKKTPLHLAAQEGHVDMCKLLIKHQIDVNAQDIMGMAALHWAVTYEHWDVVSLLMDNGANANLLDMYGRTPLFITDANISILSQLNQESQEKAKQSAQKRRRDSSDTNSYTKRRRTSEDKLTGLNFLKQHGISYLPKDDSTTIASALKNGQTAVLTEAGKQLLKLFKSYDEPDRDLQRLSKQMISKAKAKHEQETTKSSTQSKHKESSSSTGTDKSSTANLKNKANNICTNSLPKQSEFTTAQYPLNSSQANFTPMESDCEASTQQEIVHDSCTSNFESHPPNNIPSSLQLGSEFSHVKTHTAYAQSTLPNPLCQSTLNTDLNKHLNSGQQMDIPSVDNTKSNSNLRKESLYAVCRHRTTKKLIVIPIKPSGLRTQSSDIKATGNENKSSRKLITRQNFLLPYNPMECSQSTRPAVKELIDFEMTENQSANALARSETDVNQQGENIKSNTVNKKEEMDVNVSQILDIASQKSSQNSLPNSQILKASQKSSQNSLPNSQILKASQKSSQNSLPNQQNQKKSIQLNLGGRNIVVVNNLRAGNPRPVSNIKPLVPRPRVQVIRNHLSGVSERNTGLRPARLVPVSKPRQICGISYTPVVNLNIPTGNSSANIPKPLPANPLSSSKVLVPYTGTLPKTYLISNVGTSSPIVNVSPVNAALPIESTQISSTVSKIPSSNITRALTTVQPISVTPITTPNYPLVTSSTQSSPLSSLNTPLNTLTPYGVSGSSICSLSNVSSTSSMSTVGNALYTPVNSSTAVNISSDSVSLTPSMNCLTTSVPCLDISNSSSLSYPADSLSTISSSNLSNNVLNCLSSSSVTFPSNSSSNSTWNSNSYGNPTVTSLPSNGSSSSNFTVALPSNGTSTISSDSAIALPSNGRCTVSNSHSAVTLPSNGGFNSTSYSLVRDRSKKSIPSFVVVPAPAPPNNSTVSCSSSGNYLGNMSSQNSVDVTASEDSTSSSHNKESIVKARPEVSGANDVSNPKQSVNQVEHAICPKETNRVPPDDRGQVKDLVSFIKSLEQSLKSNNNAELHYDKGSEKRPNSSEEQKKRGKSRNTGKYSQDTQISSKFSSNGNNDILKHGIVDDKRVGSANNTNNNTYYNEHNERNNRATINSITDRYNLNNTFNNDIQSSGTNTNKIYNSNINNSTGNYSNMNDKAIHPTSTRTLSPIQKYSKSLSPSPNKSPESMLTLSSDSESDESTSQDLINMLRNLVCDIRNIDDQPSSVMLNEIQDQETLSMRDTLGSNEANVSQHDNIRLQDTSRKHASGYPSGQGTPTNHQVVRYSPNANNTYSKGDIGSRYMDNVGKKYTTNNVYNNTVLAHEKQLCRYDPEKLFSKFQKLTSKSRIILDSKTKAKINDFIESLRYLNTEEPADLDAGTHRGYHGRLSPLSNQSQSSRLVKYRRHGNDTNAIGYSGNRAAISSENSSVFLPQSSGADIFMNNFVRSSNNLGANATGKRVPKIVELPNQTVSEKSLHSNLNLSSNDSYPLQPFDPGSSLSQPVSNITQAIPTVAQSLSTVAQPISNFTQAIPTVGQSFSTVSQPMSTLPQGTPSSTKFPTSYPVSTIDPSTLDPVTDPAFSKLDPISITNPSSLRTPHNNVLTLNPEGSVLPTSMPMSANNTAPNSNLLSQPKPLCPGTSLNSFANLSISNSGYVRPPKLTLPVLKQPKPPPAVRLGSPKTVVQATPPVIVRNAPNLNVESSKHISCTVPSNTSNVTMSSNRSGITVPLNTSRVPISSGIAIPSNTSGIIIPSNTSANKIPSNNLVEGPVVTGYIPSKTTAPLHNRETRNAPMFKTIAPANTAVVKNTKTIAPKNTHVSKNTKPIAPANTAEPKTTAPINIAVKYPPTPFTPNVPCSDIIIQLEQSSISRNSNKLSKDQLLEQIKNNNFVFRSTDVKRIKYKK
ncbi:hypothetical protein M8J75_000661 [Diaphorina citri]|nr:hypothetical protein M8J75_000661 [Diaphorina citri]